MWLYSFAPVRLELPRRRRATSGRRGRRRAPFPRLLLASRGRARAGVGHCAGRPARCVQQRPDCPPRRRGRHTCAQEYVAGPARHAAGPPFCVRRHCLRRVRGVPLDAPDLRAGQGGRGDRYSVAFTSRRSRSKDPFGAAAWSSAAINLLVALWMLAMVSEALAARAERGGRVFAKLVVISTRIGLSIEAPCFDWHVPSLGEKPIEGTLVAGLARKRKWISRNSVG